MVPFILLLLLFAFACIAYDSGTTIEDPDFIFGGEQATYVIYRLIGNDMPPLQTIGQLRWNTEYALRNEPTLQGVHKRWILNRIWNETEFALIYQTLISNGVNRKDILLRCFDIDTFASFASKEEQLLYLTAQNEARNAGIKDGRSSGYEWTVILDGNTFISKDSWGAMKRAMEKADDNGHMYLKIPYHRVHYLQNTSWLNKRSTMKNILQYAPAKGESQMAFRKDAPELFTLGETNRDAKDSKKKRGYGQRNKSYLFKDGQICGQGSVVCECADVFEGNEEDLKGVTITTEYTRDCGLVLRLWNYPTESVIYTGLTPEQEDGFFVFLAKDRSKIKNAHTECNLFLLALDLWKGLSDDDKQVYRTLESKKYKESYNTIFLTESCFRARDREIAQNVAFDGINEVIAARKQYLVTKVTTTSTSSTKNVTRSAKERIAEDGLCKFLVGSRIMNHRLTSFNKTTLKLERDAWEINTHVSHEAISGYIRELITRATKSLTVKPMSVMNKERMPFGESDKRYYFSCRPFHWHPNDLSEKDRAKLKAGIYGYDERRTVRIDKQVNPMYPLDSAMGNKLYDRSSLYYTVTNVTTLALAWYFTQDARFAQHAVAMIDSFFLSEQTGMLPSLAYAEDGFESGIMDAKEFYVFMDALVLLESSFYLKPTQIEKMEKWTMRLLTWLHGSRQGGVFGNALNIRGIVFDLLTMSLAYYSKSSEYVDYARNRMMYRLSTAAPLGHFSLDGSQPHEIFHNSPLHYLTSNLITWIHAATVNDAIREGSGTLPSLWQVKHDVEMDDPNSDPVLLKAIRWYLQYLPIKQINYRREWSSASAFPDLDHQFPYHQKNDFQFDRMLEIFNHGVARYGFARIFRMDATVTESPIGAAAAKRFSRYDTGTAMRDSPVYATHESSTRPWPALGIITDPASGLPVNKPSSNKV